MRPVKIDACDGTVQGAVAYTSGCATPPPASCAMAGLAPAGAPYGSNASRRAASSTTSSTLGRIGGSGIPQSTDRAGCRAPQPRCDWLPAVASVADPRVEIQGSLERASNYNSWIVDQARAHIGRRVLDAGCGSGNLTSLLLDRDQVVAVDVWDDFVNVMQARFADHPNVAVHRYDLADPTMPEGLRRYELDSAICCNVLEHVEDHRAALTNIADSLVPGSPIFLLVPAFPALYGEHDRADHHFRRYTKRSLRETVEPLPIEIEDDHYMNLP